MKRSSTEASRPHVTSKIVLLLMTAAAMLVAMLGSGSATASAATTAAITAPNYTGANCGWYIKSAGLNSPYYYKITSTRLPYVTGTSATPVRVYLTVQFVHPPNQVYRTGVFYTDAVAGRWSTSWTSSSARTTGWTSLQDANGESGWIGAEFTTLDTFVNFSINWFSSAGTAITHHVSEWAYSANSSQNHNVCNAGANFA